MSLGPGTILGAYTIERLLGRGGMGEVYLATQAGLDRKVAMKVLSPELAEEPSFRDRFIAESRLAASLDHPHIVPIHEAGEVDGRLFIAMRYVEGNDLGELIAAAGRLTPERAVELLGGIAGALDSAHERGLVHRDVKPANILVARTNAGVEHAYLADFGLSRLAGSAGATRTGQLVGSVDYVAPEQIEGRPVDGRADLYSLACVLYACLTGQPPYPRETELATLWAHVQASPPEPSELDPALAPFDPVIARGMATDPADRSPTGAELIRAARAAAAGTAAGEVAGETTAGAAPHRPPKASPPLPDAPPAIRELPAQITDLIGREQELRELAGFLSTRRLITITGPGGIGKTRLAIEVGWTLPDRDLDVWFVDLAPIREADIVAAMIASRLGVPEGQRDPVARLESWLADRNVLLILDNFEQVLDAAPLVSALLAGAPGLRIVATSRAPLRLRGEREFPLGPLALPDPRDSPATIARSAAVRLFVDRARDAGVTLSVDQSNGTVLADICRRLDSMPLAIELAAARIRDLGLTGLATGLIRQLDVLTDGPRDVADRQRTLRLTLDWSHDLIGTEEALLFRRLAVFVGGFSAEAAEDVCGDGLAGSVPTILGRLIGQSLVVRSPAEDGSDRRYGMLETVRAYAWEKLDASPDLESVRRRHAESFMALAERAETELRGPDAAAWRRRIRSDLENIRAAVLWAIEEGAPEPGLRLVAALRSCFADTGSVGEARDWLTRLLALPGPRDDRIQANALGAAGNLAWLQGDFEQARVHHEAALAIRLVIGEEEPISASLSNLALVAWQLGDYRQARTLLQDSLARSRAGGDAWGAAATLGNLADIAIFELDFEAAEQLFAETLAAFRELGDSSSIAKALSNLGQLAIYRGEHDAAATFLAESRTLAAELRDDAQTNTILLNLAHLAIRRGDFSRARKDLAESFEYSRITGDRVGVVECLERLGELVGLEGDPRGAARAWGSAAVLRAEVGAEMFPVDRAWYDHDVAEMRAAIGESTFSAEWEAGRRLDPDAVVAALLEGDPGARVHRPAAAGDVLAPPTRSNLSGFRLPAQLSSFVGRETEVQDLVGLMPATRLVTLTGPGGTGKTRLAQAAAGQAAGRFGDGVALVELASITDPDLVPSQVAAVLGVADSAGQPPEETLLSALGSMRILLLLDNLEQVDIAPFVRRLLDRCPAVSVLATSRTPLHLRDEHEYPVGSLDLPDPDAAQTSDSVGRNEAVRLFADRAAAVRTDFRLTDRNARAVAAICVRVDGLPLAIELAAARVKLLSPSQILARLDDRLAILTGGSRDLPERQQTMRAAIAWSHDLLDDAEQGLFRRLAVFEGGLTFEAAEAVCLDGPDDGFLERMTELVDGSLVRPTRTADDEPRFVMLETIREYAAERLAAAGETDQLRRRHFDWYFDLGRRFEAELSGTDLGAWLDRLDVEWANLAAAMEWALGAGDVSLAVELFEFLRDYTRAHGRTSEARLLVARLLARPELGEAQRSKLLHEAAVLAVRQLDLGAVVAFATEALDLARRLGDARIAVGAGQLLALSAAERGDVAGEAGYIGQMLADADRSDDPRMQILARSHVALRSLRRGQYDEAVVQYEDLLARMGQIDVMQESMGAVYFNRGLAELHAGRPTEAAVSLAASGAIGRAMGDSDLIGYVLEGYAALASAAGRHGPAARLSGAAAKALAEVDSVLEAFEAEMSERTAAAVRAALGAATSEAERAAGAAMTSDAALDLGLSIGADLEAAPSSGPTPRAG